MANRITVSAPSRLHFGLFGGKNLDGNSFGGVGAMVSKPGLQLTLLQSEKREYLGSQADRIKEFSEAWFAYTKIKSKSGFRIEVKTLPESHIGLGTGTQLGLAVAAALFQYFIDEIPAIEQLCRSVSRGRRSAVGTYGFLHGGLIVDHGKNLDECLAKIDFHVPLPENWRFVLIKADTDLGMSGNAEETVFEEATTETALNQQRLYEIAKERIVPSVISEDFEGFSRAIYEFGNISGHYFSDIQGGPYNGQRITKLVQSIRDLGTLGVGQSSWGPTVFAVTKSETDANKLVSDLSDQLQLNETTLIARPANGGATVVVDEIKDQD